MVTISTKAVFHSILLSFFSHLFHAANGADPLFHFCSSQENYTSNNQYASSLNELLTHLSEKTPPTGFSLDSVGQANGLALCRGDVSIKDCETCVVDASKELQNRCPYKKGAIIWYDYCLLKYTGEHFCGQIDNTNKFYMWNVREIDDPAPFNQKVKELSSSLSNKAYYTPNYYAIGELKLKESKKLYGLVQCTRDLPSGNCKKCLEGIIKELPNCCNARIGGRVVSGSCNFGYELYPIVASQQ